MHALYVGLDAPPNALHIPLIEIVPKKLSLLSDEITHIIITSKTTVHLHHELLPKDTMYFSVGKATSACLKKYGITNVSQALNECQEGIIEEIEKHKLNAPSFYYPHSSLSRPILKEYLDKKGYRYTEEIAYETHFKPPSQEIDFSSISAIYFTSPSTVDAFFHFFGKPLEHISLHPIGPITSERIQILQ